MVFKKITWILLLILLSSFVSAFYISEDFNSIDNSLFNNTGDVSIDAGRLKIINNGGAPMDYSCYNISSQTGTLSGVYNISYDIEFSDNTQRFQSGGWTSGNAFNTAERNSVLFGQTDNDFEAPYGTALSQRQNNIPYNITHEVNETGQTYRLWINETLETGWLAFSNAVATNYVCWNTWSTAYPQTIYVDNLIINNETAPASITNFTIFAKDKFTGSSLLTFNATINGIVFNSSATGNITTAYYNINGTILNITVNSQNYTAQTFTNYNSSTDLTANLSYYYYTNYTFTPEVIETTISPFIFIINTSSFVDSTAVTLTYNNTAQTVTKTSFANYDLFTSNVEAPTLKSDSNITFIWNYTINSASLGNKIGSFTENQSVIKIGIDNCTTYNTHAINFTVIDDDTAAIIPNATLNGAFTAYNVGSLGSVPFNLTWAIRDNSDYGLCIDPNSTSFLFSAQLEYSASGYAEKNYYFNNNTLDNVTEIIELILTNGTTATTITITDQDDNVVQDVYVYVLSYDFGTDTAKTSEIVKTDSYGKAIAQIVTTNKWYKFILVYEGLTVLETEPQKVLTNELNFRINLLQDYFVDYNDALEVSCDVDYSNSTGFFTYTFNDPTGNIASGCLKVVKKEIYSDTLVNQTCVTSSGGTIDIAINNTDPYQFMGYGYIVVDNNNFACDTDVADLSQTWRTYGTSGLFPSLILAITLPMVSILFPPGAIIIMMMTFIVLSLIGLFHISWPYMISLMILGGITLFKVSNK